MGGDCFDMITSCPPSLTTPDTPPDTNQASLGHSQTITIITLTNQAISAEQLLEFLADLLLDTRPDALNTGPDFHYNVNDAIDILPKLQTGLDVNVR